MVKTSFTGTPPSSDPKTGLTKVPTGGPPSADPGIPSQDPAQWSSGGTAPQSDEVTPGPGTAGAPTPKGMTYGQMKTAAKAANAAKAAQRRSQDV